MINERIKQLRKEINRHNLLYYIHAAPEISDSSYDSLLRQLRELEDQYPDLKDPTSPTNTVGSKGLSRFTEYRHGSQMLSIANIFDYDGLRLFTTKLNDRLNKEVVYRLEPKIDGVSINLVYQEGILKVAVTRGDGSIGEIVSNNVFTILSIPKVLIPSQYPIPSDLEIRGEIYINKDDFISLNDRLLLENKKTYANPRNAAAGNIRRLDPVETAQVPLQFVCHSISGAATLAQTYQASTLTELFDIVASWGVPTVPEILTTKSTDEIHHQYLTMLGVRDSLAYEIDGLVIKVDDVFDQGLLGATTQSPKWAVAYKFPPTEVTTQVRSIVIQVGRTGALTPVANLEPVQVGGVVISNATLHNPLEIKLKDIRVGDTVIVRRAGDVIPEIVVSLPELRDNRSRPYEFPEKCPSCSSPVVYLNEEGIPRCSGTLICPDQTKQAIIHFASRPAMNIDGLGEKTVSALYEAGLLTNIVSIYQLIPSQLTRIDGIGLLTAHKLVTSIIQSKGPALHSFIYALGIRGVGLSTAQALVKYYPNIESLVSADIEDLERIRDIGPVSARNIQSFFRDSRNSELISQLLNLGIKPILSTHDLMLADQTYVLTGTFENYSRLDLTQRLEALGARVSNQVNKCTTSVFVGRASTSKPSSSKLRKANILNIQILNEDDLIGLLAKR